MVPVITIKTRIDRGYLRHDSEQHAQNPVPAERRGMSLKHCVWCLNKASTEWTRASAAAWSTSVAVRWAVG